MLKLYEWGGNIIYIYGTNHPKGVAILFNSRLDVYIERFEADKNRRYLLPEAAIFESMVLF